MSNANQFYSNRWLFRGMVIVLVSLFMLARISYGGTQSKETTLAVLQGAIHIQPTQPITNDEMNKIQPGTPLKLTVSVENKGQEASAPGELFIRYAFAKPLEKEAGSAIFESERKSLPSIEPGEKIDISFDTPHQTPSMMDFIRHDWSMRDYQAVVSINNKEYVIGTLALTFSAYYYPGIRKKFPTSIESKVEAEAVPATY